MGINEVRAGLRGGAAEVERAVRGLTVLAGAVERGVGDPNPRHQGV